MMNKIKIKNKIFQIQNILKMKIKMNLIKLKMKRKMILNKI